LTFSNRTPFLPGLASRRFSSTEVQPLLSPGRLGDLTLKNRVVVSALTRQRATRSGAERGVPNELHVEYYSKRAADAGLVLTECSWISKESDAFPGSTGIAND